MIFDQLFDHTPRAAPIKGSGTGFTQAIPNQSKLMLIVEWAARIGR